MFKCGSKNGHKKYTCLNEIGIRAQNMVTILDLMVNVNGGRENLYDHLMNMRIFVESSL